MPIRMDFSGARLALGLWAAAQGTGALAAGLAANQHPKEYCELAAEAGYPSRGYKAHTGGCSSAMRELSAQEGRNGMANNLAFYAMGTVGQPSKLQRVSLILNVNNEAQTRPARRELSRVSQAVALKLLGQVPPGLEAAVLEGKSRQLGRISGWSVEVVSTPWPTKLGHDINVRFLPAEP